MGRLIDADALLAEYDRVHVGPPGGARKLIENAPTVTPDSDGGWILCSERMPEVRQRVIVTLRDGSMSVRRCIDGGHLAWFYANTVAWMHCPEPYKEENDG